ncbi:MAG: helicase-exonuclease AddAB subunit AddB [Lachnospiraceae bacterium]|nr:helicase-exonuclease AddAB subunit AddB [Lachnospiraceae bacterium]
MSLQLILGRSGAGKSHFLYENVIRESMENPKMSYFVIVPEQFTMETQHNLVSMHPNHGIQNIDVLSFLRLSYRIFEEQGKRQGTVLEDTGKSMLVRKVIGNKKEELQLLKNNVKKIGYVSEIKSLLSEFLQYNIKKEDIEKMINVSQKEILLQRKLEDMLVIYEGFQELLQEKYITAEEILDVLAQFIPSSNLLKDGIVCLDGFTGFTPVQYKLIQELLKHCKEVRITLTLDERENINQVGEEFHLFYTTKKTIHKLYKIAKENGVMVNPEVWIRENQIPYRFMESPELACLEDNLFRFQRMDYDKYKEEHKIENPESNIYLFEAGNPQGEVDAIMGEIFRLVREEGYRYRDIAILTGDIEAYSPMVEKACKKLDFPSFIDYKKDIMKNPLVELIRSLLDIFRNNYDYESMFRYLRCGLVDIPKEDVDMLENYVIALGIKSKKRWNQMWTRIYRKDVEIDIEYINEIRQRVIENLEILQKGFSKRENTVLSYTTHLHEYLLKQNVYFKIKEYEKSFEERNMPLLAKEYSQVYSIVLEIFDKIVELLGEETITIGEYSDLLEIGFTEAKVGLIPPGVDQIVMGDMERTRLKDIKALFVLGVNEGIIPKNTGKGGLISDVERELLESNLIELAPTSKQSAYMQQFHLYINLTKPKNKLYLSYHKVNQEGKMAMPSYLISKIRKIFPDLVTKEEVKLYVQQDLVGNQIDQLLNHDLGNKYLLSGLQEYEKQKMADWWKELFRFYKKQPGFEESLQQLIRGAGYVNEEKGLSKQVAEALYGKKISNSVTRVERYVSCAFAHFLQYGLQLKERYEFRFGGVDFGNIFHDVLRIFPNRLKEKNYTWKTIPVEEMHELIEKCVREVAADYGNAILTSSKRNAYMIERMCRIMKRTLWALSEQIKKGDFEPTDYEVTFSYMDGLENAKMDLGEERIMQLQGRIDRIDQCETDFDSKDAVYVKIIDYKSGSTKFQIDNMYYGLQMQLIVYMNAAMELKKQENPDKEVKTAGIFYYNMEDPIIDRPTNEGKREEEILKELKMDGLVNNKNQVIQLFDRAFGTDGNLEKSVKSLVIPVETTKDGLIGARSSSISEEQFGNMGEYINLLMKKYGKEILEGNTSIYPYEKEDKTACDFCSFKPVCNFDRKLPGNQYRRLEKLSKNQVWDKIKEDLE